MPKEYQRVRNCQAPIFVSIWDMEGNTEVIFGLSLVPYPRRLSVGLSYDLRLTESPEKSSLSGLFS